MASRRCLPASLASPSRTRPARPSPPMRASRRKPRHAPPTCRRSPTIQVSCVDALDGEPGIYSARWAGPNKDFRQAMERIDALLRERGAMTPDQRKAHFVSALCVAWPDGHLEEFEARVDGTLVWPPRGDAGLRLRSDVSSRRPYAYLRRDDRATKNMDCRRAALGLSHRARAFVKLAEACLAADVTSPAVHARRSVRRLCALAVLPVEMPLLRLQQPCPPWRRSTRRALCAPSRPRSRTPRRACRAAPCRASSSAAARPR